MATPGAYLALHYFTAEGRRLADEARLNITSTFDIAAGRSSAHGELKSDVLKRDRDLSLDQIREVSEPFCQLVNRYKWGGDGHEEGADPIAEMFFNFFYNVETHPFRNKTGENEHGPAALALYAERTRRRWHANVGQGPIYSIAEVDEKDLLECQQSIRDIEMSRLLKVRLLPTSSSLLFAFFRVLFFKESSFLSTLIFFTLFFVILLISFPSIYRKRKNWCILAPLAPDQFLRCPLILQSVLDSLAATPPLRARLFRETQTVRPRAFASYALGRTGTTCSAATPNSSMAQASPPLLVEPHSAILSPARDISSFVQLTSSADALPITKESSRIYALFAESTSTERAAALEQRRQQPQTPFNADAWEQALSRLGLLHRFRTVLSILRHGADAGILPIAQTFTPPNSASVVQNLELFESLMLHEFESNRFFGPFTGDEVENLLHSPFQTSPISLVPKPNTSPPKFRPVNNLSHPHKPIQTSPSSHITSVNYSIDADNYPCTWGTFAVCALLVARLPPGSQAAVRDVSEAYRRIPITPAQWAGTVIRLTSMLFAINVALLFGLVSSGGVWGLVADALCAILRASGA